jgi:hypothetical protein
MMSEVEAYMADHKSKNLSHSQRDRNEQDIGRTGSYIDRVDKTASQRLELESNIVKVFKGLRQAS